MGFAQRYVDVSAFQGNIDWPLYRTWSDMAAMKATEGTGFMDARYQTNKAGAEAAGVRMVPYHYARPDLNSAQAEAQWFFKVAANTPDLFLMLDDEQNTIASTAEWAYAWLSECEQLFQQTPTVYASDSFIRARLQDSRLVRFSLILAKWTFDPNARPACPPPWTHYVAVQYTDRAVNIPGIAGLVDADIFLGGLTMGVPQGWSDDGSTLVAPNGHRVVLGFREHVLNSPGGWPAWNQPLEEEWHADPLELSNPSLGAGQKQSFNATTLEWTPARGVFEAWQGQEIVALRAEIAKLQAQLAQPVQVDISLVEKDINAIADAIAAPVAQALTDLKKL